MPENKEAPWYISLMERIATAAWYYMNNPGGPTEKQKKELVAALADWDKRLGWDGKFRETLINMEDDDDIEDAEFVEVEEL